MGVMVTTHPTAGADERAAAVLRAVRDSSRALLHGEPPEAVLEQLAASARRLVGADLATIVVPVDHDPSLLSVRVAVGRYASAVRGREFPRRASLSGRVMDALASEVVADAAEEPAAHQPIVALGRFGPALFVPLLARGEAFGTLVVANRRGGRELGSDDVDLVETFAAQAAIVLESVRAEQALLALSTRERVGRELHDTVIQRLFAAGLTLEAVRDAGLDPQVAERLEVAVSDLDTTIRQIRATIFPLDAPAGPPSVPRESPTS
jgi:GAF domain-containing protein